MASVQIDLTALGALTPTIVNAQLALQSLSDMSGSVMFVTPAQLGTMKSWPQMAPGMTTRLVDNGTYASPYGNIEVTTK